MTNPTKLIAAFLLTIPALNATAESSMGIRFSNETTDTTHITEILISTAAQTLPTGKNMVAIAERLIGTPYAAGPLESSPEMLTVNMDAFDCTTFVETVAALTKTVDEGRSSWRDFTYNLKQLRYRGGNIDGYGSRLHYISDWIVDNSHRGNLKDVTDRITNADFQVKTIDFMSSNRDKYPALSDSASFAAIKNMEIGYRSHRFPFIKASNIQKVQLADGDIIAITTSIKNLDVTHMGIVKIIDGKPHLIHASSKEKKVIIDPLTLPEYLRRNRNATGIRVFRLK